MTIMRSVIFFLLMFASACTSDASQGNDAGATVDLSSSIDAASDAAPPDSRDPCTSLLVGGTDVAAQGWSVVMQTPATVSYGPDYVRLVTSTSSGGGSSGQLLLSYADAVTFGKPFTLRVEMLVELVNAHNQFDSAAAIMGSYTPSAGSTQDRSQMIYLDSGKIGWADNSQSFTTSVQDNMYHTYELTVDASKIAHVSVDGQPALTRNGFVWNGRIAIGDQTNDPNVDSALRIRLVKVCP